MIIFLHVRHHNHLNKQIKAVQMFTIEWLPKSSPGDIGKCLPASQCVSDKFVLVGACENTLGSIPGNGRRGSKEPLHNPGNIFRCYGIDEIA
jgi:hypothetical protein